MDEKKAMAARANRGARGNKKGVKARKIAVEILTRIDVSGAYANLALDHALDKSDMEARDRAFTTALVLGVLRQREAIDQELRALASQPLEKIRPPVLNLLRVAIFQLNEMSDIPESAVLDTAGDIARLVGHEGIVKFVTGILRAYLRNPHKAGKADLEREEENSLKLARQYSMPHWLVVRWLNAYGESETLSLLKHCQVAPALTLRVNSLAIETEAMAAILLKKGIKTRVSELVPTCLIVESRGKDRPKLEEFPGFAEGIFTVQDEAAAFVSQVVQAAPGETVIDLCAAPGGKTMNMAEHMEGKGRIIAVDIHDSRLKLLRETRQRLGLRNIETRQADGRFFKFEGGADRVLVDAPCSGTGVIAKRSDLRLNRLESDLEKLTRLQTALLNNAAKLVRPGGLLVYSTCSIEKEEGPQIVAQFLAEHSDFQLEDLSEAFPPDLVNKWNLAEEAHSGQVMFLPSRHAPQGFYIARLRKSADLPEAEHEQEPGGDII